MADEPPFFIDDADAFISSLPDSTREKYWNFTDFMREIAMAYETTRAANFEANSLVFLIEKNGTSSMITTTDAHPCTARLQNMLKQINRSARLGFILSLTRDLRDQLKENGIDPSVQDDWPDKPVNCTDFHIETWLSRLPTPHALDDHPDIHWPEFRIGNKHHAQLTVHMVNRSIRGVVDGKREEDDFCTPRPIHARLCDVATNNFKDVPSSLAKAHSHFDCAFVKGHRIFLAFLRNLTQYEFSSHHTAEEACSHLKKRMKQNGYHLFMALTTDRDFMEQVRAAPYKFTSPQQAIHYPIISPGVFPNHPPQKKISCHRPEPQEWR